MCSNRKSALFYNEHWRLIEGAFGIFTLISGYFQFGASFSASTPTEIFGVIMNSFYMGNVSIYIFIGSLILFITFNILWIISKNAPPLVNLYCPANRMSDGGEIYLEMKTTEPSGLKDAHITIISLFYGQQNLELAGNMNPYRIIRFGKELVKGELGEICIADTVEPQNRLHVRLNIKDRSYFLIVWDKAAKYWEGEYKMIFEFYAHPNDEKYPILVGTFEAIMIHKRYNMIDGPDGDFIFWKQNSFKQVKEKSELKRLKKLSNFLISSN
jgi:hypothetical protein